MSKFTARIDTLERGDMISLAGAGFLVLRSKLHIEAENSWWIELAPTGPESYGTFACVFYGDTEVNRMEIGRKDLVEIVEDARG